MLELFEDAVQRWGLPSTVRNDHGLENILVLSFMIVLKYQTGSIITGLSVHNCRGERTHQDVYAGMLVFYANIFQELEDDGSSDVFLKMIFTSLIYILQINNSLNESIQQMNNRSVSSERNQIPLQMWKTGMLESINSGHTALSTVEIEDFGLDPDGVLSVEEGDYQVLNIVPPSFDLSDEQISQLPDFYVK